MPNYPPCCVENVKYRGGVLCEWDLCREIQHEMDSYCKNDSINPCSAVPQYLNRKICYCCCSCFAYNTPIEAATGEYVAVQDIVANVDQILAGSYQPGAGAPQWKQRVVEYSWGIAAGEGEEELEFDYLYYIAYQTEDGSQPPQFILTTVDHLFLRPNGKVTPIQFLTPGDAIVNSHGGFSRVRFVVPARYRGGLHHVTFADFDNRTLDEHLISANGVVTADYAVQLAYSDGHLNPALVDAPADGPLLRASEDAYRAQYANQAALDFVSDSARWPTGMTPLAAEPMVNVPSQAKSFLTPEQAADVRASAPQLPPDNTENVSGALWLFEIFGAFFGKPVYLVDWQNETPNAYAWTVNRQVFVLLTGGLLRVQTISQEGLSLVLAHLVAASEGVACVGPADYDAVFSKTRRIWRDSLFAHAFSDGYDQVATLFGYVSEENAKGDPADICGRPSLECRLLAMREAARMGPLPDCANPDLWFGLVSAKTGRQLRHVAVTFNAALNKETAETTANYAIAPEEGDGKVKVEKAELSTLNPTEVRLQVTVLQQHADYRLTVANVLSASERRIDPGHDSAGFAAGKLMN